MNGYRHRIMDNLLAKKLQAKGAVLIEGPKWCGKTTTAEEIAASKVRKDHDCGRDSGEQGTAGKDRREGAVQAFVGDRQRYGTVR